MGKKKKVNPEDLIIPPQDQKIVVPFLFVK